jgi:hypothetical protein
MGRKIFVSFFSQLLPKVSRSIEYVISYAWASHRNGSKKRRRILCRVWVFFPPILTNISVGQQCLTLFLLMWRIWWAPNSIPIYSYNQQDVTLHSLFISGNCSTYFGWYFHPASGAHTTVSTASGVCHTATAICRYRGRVGTSFSALWVAYATHSTLKPVPTHWAPDDGRENSRNMLSLNKCQDNKLKNCCIRLVIYLN